MQIGLIQMTSVLDYKVNLEYIDNQINILKNKAPNLSAVFLPEVFYSISDGTRATPHLIEGENEHYTNIKNIAIKHGVYLLGGSAATKLDDKVINRAFNFSPEGELLNFYDKIHLFSVCLKSEMSSTVIDESKVYTCGSELKTLEVGDFKFGFSICFDLRFAEMYRKYYGLGVNVITVPSAFTRPTGAAHWESLIRARAIENQSYVIAANQCGEHNDKIKTYGHSMVVDPWGEIIAACADKPESIICELDIKLIEKVRTRINMSSKLLT